MTQIQYWSPLRSGAVTHELADDSARVEVQRLLSLPGVSEIVVWWPEHEITHAIRQRSTGAWHFLRGDAP